MISAYYSVKFKIQRGIQEMGNKGVLSFWWDREKTEVLLHFG